MKASLSFFNYNKNNCFKNKNIIITGATGGIGKVLTRILSMLGANILLVCRDETKVNVYFSDIMNEKNKPKILFEIVDLSHPNEITEKFPSIVKKLHGIIDIIFFCHGIYSKKTIRDGNILDFDTILNVNVRSIFHFLSLSIPFLKITKGNVVMISSLESKIPILCGGLNSISKSMLNSLIENSALELASFGIRINGVAPGVTNTEHRIDKDFSEKSNQKFMELQNSLFILDGKVLEPDDIVNTMLFLASDQASFITGEVIIVDKGYSLDHEGTFSNIG